MKAVAWRMPFSEKLSLQPWTVPYGMKLRVNEVPFRAIKCREASMGMG